MFTRREFLSYSGACVGAGILTGCAASNPPLKSIDLTAPDYKQIPASALATSVTNEHHYEAVVEGKIPRELNGVFYRNGPGLFERNGLRKRCLLDGDGMIQAFRITDGNVAFQNKFVRTAKYIEEAAAGEFLYATWTTQAPGGVLSNLLGGKTKSQAGITAMVRRGKLYAFDDSHPPYELDAATLKTKGFTDLGMPRNSTILYAHSKIDGKSGDWIFFGLEFGLRVLLHITIFGKDGRLKGHREIKLPRPAYMHDFFATDRYLVFNLPAMSIDFFEYLMGQKSFLGSMRWTPEIGNIILVIDRQGDTPPFQLSAEPCWMWHVINAYERGNEIIADFIGYQNPDHIIGDDPALCAVMEGRKGQYNFPGEIRRYIIHTTRQSVYSEILDKGDYEFPFVNPRHVCHRHRFGYFANKLKGEIFFTGIARVDMETLDSDSYRFGKEVFCSEPVFIPKPQYLYSSANNAEPGWLLTEVFDAGNLKTSLALLESDCLSDGPVAWVHLSHLMPLGLHGFWHPYS